MTFDTDKIPRGALAFVLLSNVTGPLAEGTCELVTLYGLRSYLDSCVFHRL